MPDFPYLFDTTLKLLAALPLTLELFAVSAVFAALLGGGLVWMRVSRNPILDCLAQGYIFVFRGSPLLVQTFLIYYGLGQFALIRYSAAWPILKQPFWCAVLALALCSAGYTAEIFRGGLLGVSPQEVEAARACGMSGFLLFRRIILPLAFRRALPAYSTELILLVKSTSLASIITVMEMTGVAARIIAHSYRTMEVFFCAGVIYLLINFLISRGVAGLEYWLSPRLRRS